MSTISNSSYIKNKLMKSPFYTPIIRTLNKLKSKIYFVGGCIRDAILNRDTADIDIIPFGCDYEVFARVLAKEAKAYSVNFKDNVRLTKNHNICDVTKPRGNNINEDIMKRDFTVNNLASDIEGNITGNTEDIEKGIIRLVYPCAFDDDPLRILRGFRFMSSLGFSMEENTFQTCINKKELLKHTAKERITEEILKILEGGHKETALNLIEKSGVFNVVFPNINIDYISPLRLEKFSFPSALALLAGKNAVKYMSLSSEQEKNLIYLCDNLPNALKLPNMNLREKKSFLWEHYEKAESLLDFTAAKYPDMKEEVIKCRDIIKTLDVKNAEKINGKLLKEMGFTQGKIFGIIIKDVSEKLALNELSENDIKDYIKINYGDKL